MEINTFLRLESDTARPEECRAVLRKSFVACFMTRVTIENTAITVKSTIRNDYRLGNVELFWNTENS